MSGAPRGSMTPDMARRQMDMLRGMRPEDLEAMAEGRGGAAGPAGGPSAADAERAAEMLKVRAAVQPVCRAVEGE